MWNEIETAIKDRVIMIDGAMGTSLQKYKLTEEDYRGDRFADWHSLVKGNNDLLSISKPDVVRAVHDEYFAAGADLIETNTFNATSISQADYEMSDLAAEIAEAGAKLAREVADAWSAKIPDKPRGVMGAVGPLNVTLSISPKVEDPGFRAVTFDQVEAAYVEQMRAMWPYVDAILIETVFDTLNAKAAISAAKSVAEELGEKPLMISGTITDRSGRTLSGQTAEAFWLSVSHAKPFAIGLNCALGAEELRPYVAELSRVANTHVLAYPNAGLPNAFGEYDETPNETAAHIKNWAEAGLVNMVGGCCGTTPEHIAAIARAVEGCTPRTPANYQPGLYLSGLEPFRIAS